MQENYEDTWKNPDTFRNFLRWFGKNISLKLWTILERVWGKLGRYRNHFGVIYFSEFIENLKSYICKCQENFWKFKKILSNIKIILGKLIINFGDGTNFWYILVEIWETMRKILEKGVILKKMFKVLQTTYKVALEKF